MRRYERASTLLTSNRPVEDWGKLLGDVAAVTYRFAVRYTLEGEDAEHDETGQEVLMLRRAPSGWKALWRTQTTD